MDLGGVDAARHESLALMADSVGSASSATATVCCQAEGVGCDWEGPDEARAAHEEGCAYVAHINECVRSGTIESLIEEMLQHMDDDPDSVSHYCSGLASITYGDEQGLRAVRAADNGAIEVAIQAIERWPGHQHLAHQALGLLHNLSCGTDRDAVYRSRRVVYRGGREAINSAMYGHQLDSHIQEFGKELLDRLPPELDIPKSGYGQHREHSLHWTPRKREEEQAPRWVSDDFRPLTFPGRPSAHEMYANPPRTEQEITDVLTGKVGSDALADFDRRLNERKARLFAEEPPLSERQRGDEPREPPYGFEDGSETKAEVERRLPMTLEAAAALYEG